MELSDEANTSDHSLCIHVETIIVAIDASENLPERFGYRVYFKENVASCGF